MSEKPQEKPLQGPQPKPHSAGWKTVAIGILIAIVIGLIMIAIGSAKIKRGAQMQREAELRLGDVVQYLAADAKAEADQMDEYLRQSNWGLATKRMGKLTEAVSLLDQIAPEAKRSQVEQVKDACAQAQEAIDSHAGDWRDKLDNLRSALDPLTGGS